MADVIKAPNSCPGAIPTKLGWKHPTRNEILVKRKFTQEQIDAFFAVRDHVPPAAPVAVTIEEPEDTIELPSEEMKEIIDAFNEANEEEQPEVKKSMFWPFPMNRPK